MTEPLTNDQIFIRKLTDIILENLGNENFGEKELAHESGMSLYRINRKLHSINKKTSNQFIREVRLQKAFEMLQEGVCTASEVAYKVGFGSPTYFNKSFHEYYGYPPGKVMKGDKNNTELIILTQSAAESRLRKSAWRTYILTLPGILLIGLLLGTVVFLMYRKINKSERIERLISSDSRISIAVMPIQNMVNDTTLNIWQDCIQQSLISSLANTREIKVRQKESVKSLLQTQGLSEYAAISSAIAGAVARKLEADLFICGYLQQAGTEIRLDAQLIDTKTKEVLQSFEEKRPYKQEIIFDLTDSLRKKVTDFLIISKLIKENPIYGSAPLSTNYPDALKYYIYGDKANEKGDSPTAISWYLKALAVDSNFFEPMIRLSSVYANLGMMEQNLQKNQWPYFQQLGASWAYAFSFEPPEEGIKYLRQAQQIDDQDPSIPYLLGYTYNRIDQYDNAIIELEKFLEISRKWSKEYMKSNSVYLELGNAYHKTGQYKKEKKLYKIAEKYIPDDPWIIRFQTILALAEKDSIATNRYIEKYITVLKKNHPLKRLLQEDWPGFTRWQVSRIKLRSIIVRHSHWNLRIRQD
ncbi:MAG: helix-turn-helix domain-containing protein [Bacteroidales bacterium]|nr:helix-turn-helix domain-containing protein [Bacteroidales bacterium]